MSHETMLRILRGIFVCVLVGVPVWYFAGSGDSSPDLVCKQPLQTGELRTLYQNKDADACDHTVWQAPADSQDLNVPKIYSEQSQNMVYVKVDFVNGHRRMGASGSGVIVSAGNHQRRVLTADHVIRPDPGQKISRITVFLEDGRSFKMRIHNTSSVTDLATLDFPSDAGNLPSGATVAADASSGDEPVLVMGHPRGSIDLFVSPGMLLGDSKWQSLGIDVEGLALGDHTRVLQVAGHIEEGNSGGPLFNRNGEVIGIVSFSGNTKEFGAIRAVQARRLIDGPPSKTQNLQPLPGSQDSKSSGSEETTTITLDWRAAAFLLIIFALRFVL